MLRHMIRTAALLTALCMAFLSLAACAGPEKPGPDTAVPVGSETAHVDTVPVTDRETETAATEATETEAPPEVIPDMTYEVSEESDVQRSGNNTVIYRYAASYPVFAGGPEGAAALINETVGIRMDLFRSDASRLASDAAVFYREDPDNFFQPYFFRVTASVTRLDGACASLLFTEESYDGGNESDSLLSAYSWDPATGEDLVLTDNEDGFWGVVSAEILDWLSPRRETLELYDDFESLADKYMKDCWYLTEDAFVVVFNTYVLAPRTAGAISVSIPLERLGAFLADSLCGDLLK